jgi:hypothetical protein
MLEKNDYDASSNTTDLRDVPPPILIHHMHYHVNGSFALILDIV